MDEEDIVAVLALLFLFFYFMPYAIPETGERSVNPLINGLYLLHDYAVYYIIPLIPALFITGAVSVFLPKGDLIKNLEKKPVSGAYVWALFSGALLAVYSSMMFPIFAGLRKKKVDIGPAISFLYAASALNILSILFVGIVLGPEYSLALILFSLVFALLIGVFSSRYFGDEGRRKYTGLFEYWDQLKEGRGLKELDSLPAHDPYELILFFAGMLALLVTAAWPLDGVLKTAVILILLGLLWLHVKRSFRELEIRIWLKETYLFSERSLPLLFMSVFIMGLFSSFMLPGSLENNLGGNSAVASILGSVFGASLYFPTLTDVPIAKTLLDYGMGAGGVLAFLLTAQMVSPTTMFVLSKIIGVRRTTVYVILTVVLSILAGLIFGFFF